MKALYSNGILAALGISVALMTCVSTAHANVYATNIKLNGALTNTSAAAGSPVTITYILNEPASTGVTLNVLDGSTAVRSIEIAAGQEGAKRGLNTVTWDGKTNGGQNAAAGTYSVSITARASGYPGWTQLTDDTNDGNQVWEGRGIGVDRNTNSLYYGRVFVGNASYHDGSFLGYQVGILKCNADASYADEGGFSTGGYTWAGDFYSPWHLEISDDSYVYVNDWTGSGEIFRWDPTIDSSTRLHVLRPDNYPATTVNMSGPAIFGTGTNTTVWMADIRYPGSFGILRWAVTEDGTLAQYDIGVTAVGIGLETNLTLYPYDVALDKYGNIYTVQYRANAGDPSSRVMRFAAYDPLTNSYGLTAEWAIGNADDTMGGATGIAVDPTATYVAVAFRGIAPASGRTNGCTQIFYATNGMLVTNLDLGVTISGNITHQDTDCAWDAVGNLYYIDNYYGCWRAVSPPGANEATTVAVPKLELVQALQITGLTVAGATATIDFAGSSSDPASAFKVLSAAVVTGPFEENTAATIAVLSPGVFRATVPATGPTQFYRIMK